MVNVILLRGNSDENTAHITMLCLIVCPKNSLLTYKNCTSMCVIAIAWWLSWAHSQRHDREGRERERETYQRGRVNILIAMYQYIGIIINLVWYLQWSQRFLRTFIVVTQWAIKFNVKLPCTIRCAQSCGILCKVSSKGNTALLITNHLN